MKRLPFLILYAALLIIPTVIFAQQGSKRLSLTDIVNDAFSQESPPLDMRPLPDGEHFSAMNREGTMIIKYAYRTGQPVETLFDVKNARECPFVDFQDYEISSTGHHILIFRERERLYRHSTQAVVYDYDVRRRMVKPLNESGKKIRVPTFSPDGRMCAFVEDNNIRIRKFDYDTETVVTNEKLYCVSMIAGGF